MVFVRIVIAAFVAAVLMFMLGMIAFAKLGPEYNHVEGLRADKALIEAIQKAVPADGVYRYPDENKEKVPITKDNLAKLIEPPQYSKELMELVKTGPLIQLIVQKEGMDLTKPDLPIKGFVQTFAAALLLAVMITWASPSLGGFFGRWLFAALMGVFAGVLMEGADHVWNLHPLKHSLFVLAFEAAQCFLGGFVLAMFCWRRTKQVDFMN